jgi:hypothetical protein
MPGLDGTTGQSAEQVLNTFPRYTCLGCVTNESIEDEAITSRAVSPGSITRDKIATGAVTALHIADEAITTEKIVDGEVSSAKIADYSVEGRHIESYDCVFGMTAQCGEVLAGHIRTDAVIDGKLADRAVEAGDIQPSAVQPSNLTFAGHIATGAVGTNDIADDAVTSPKITLDTIERRHIQQGAVNRMWTTRRNNYQYISSSYSTWQDLANMSWEASNGDPGNALYLVLFSADFYCNEHNCSAEVRLVAEVGASDVELVRSNLFSDSSEYRTITNSYCRYRCGFFCGWCENWCETDHNHNGSPLQGTASLRWIGNLNPTWTRLRIQWRKEADWQFWQWPSDRILTVIEFKNALLTP